MFRFLNTNAIPEQVREVTGGGSEREAENMARIDAGKLEDLNLVHDKFQATTTIR